MRYVCVLLIGGLALLAQDKPAEEKPAARVKAKAGPAAPGSDEEKALRREKARELLDSAAKMVASVQPQVQVASLLHLGDNYNLIDSKKSLELLEQAFAAAADLPSTRENDQRGDMQSQIIYAAADVSLDKAVELITQLPPPSSARAPDRRLRPVEKIVQLLLQKEQFDRAIQLIENIGSTGEYPIRTARLIFEKLPEGDPRRVQVFGGAVTAYVSRPLGPLGEFLSRHWQAVPRPMAESGLQALLNAILAIKDDEEPMTTTLATAKGAVGFSSRQDRELFDILHVIQAIEPKRAAELLEKRPELRAAIEKFPMGVTSMRSAESDSMSTSVNSGDKPNAQRRAQEQLQAIAQSRAAEAMGVAKENPQQALGLVRGIPVPAVQARVLGSIARSVSEKDPTTAKSVLDQCVKILDDLKEPSQRLQVWEIVAEAAYRAKEEERARQAIDRGLDDAAELYKRDTDVERGNNAMREYWPSTQSYRRLIHRAANLWGADAETLLVKITDPELALMARIEMGQALLGRETSANQTRFSGRGNEQRLQTR